MLKKIYSVYMHVNKINGKKYIGITCNIQKRWKNNGVGYKQENGVFWRAIVKYDWNNFEHIILETGLTLEEAQAKEQYYIAKYNTYIKDKNCNGYNMTRGGESMVHIQKRVEQLDLNYKVIAEFESITQAAETLGLDTGNIQKACKTRHSKSGGYYWRYKGEPNWKPVLKNNDNYCKSKVYCIELNKIYRSVSHASKELNIKSSSISHHCKLAHNNKEPFISKGYHFCYIADKESFINQYVIRPIKILQQFSKDGTLLKEFIGRRSACKELNIDEGNLSKAILSKKLFRGFFWKDIIKPACEIAV